jgi:hypothetical protein
MQTKFTDEPYKRIKCSTVRTKKNYINTTLSRITLNVNGLNNPIKRQMLGSFSFSL